MFQKNDMGISVQANSGIVQILATKKKLPLITADTYPNKRLKIISYRYIFFISVMVFPISSTKLCGSNTKFILSGKWAATVIDMEMECNSPTGNREAHNVTIYEADVSKAGGLVRVFGFNNHHLLSVELKDYNSDGKKDLLVLMLPPTITGQYLRIVAKDFDTWATISDKIYPTSNIK